MTNVVATDTRLAVVQSGGVAVRVEDRAAKLAPARQANRVLEVADVGLQGPTGPTGDNFDTRFASGAIGGHRIVRSVGDNRVGYADCLSIGHGDDTVGLTLASAIDGDSIPVQRAGRVTFNGWSWTPGAPVFVGTNGLPTQSLPQDALFVQVIGHAEDATTLFLNLSPPVF